MRKVNGILLLVISLLLLVLNLYYLIVEPFLTSSQTFPTNQYWALAIPVSVGVFLFLSVSIWVGYTMIVTPEPIRSSYQEAYENAVNSDSNGEK